MLDNPNLSLEKMGEVIALGKDIIGISIIIIVLFLIYMYRYQIRILIKHGFSDSKNMRSPSAILQLMKTNMSELEKKDLNSKVDNLLHKFENPELDDDDIELLENVDNLMSPKDTEYNPPIFRSLKTIKSKTEITFHFVNDGGAIHNYQIIPIDGFTISIEPQNNLESNGSGYLKFEFANNNIENEISFDFSYYDEANNFHEEKCQFSILENQLSIVETE